VEDENRASAEGEEAVEALRDAARGEWWAVWEAAQRLLPPDTPPFLLHGLTGGALRRQDDVALYNDLGTWVTPGLATLDIRAVPTLLPADRAECATLLRAALRGGRTLPLLLFEEKREEEENPQISQIDTDFVDRQDHFPLPTPPRSDPGTGVPKSLWGEPLTELLRQRLIVGMAAGLDEIILRAADGQELMVGISWLLGGNAVVVKLLRHPHQGTRRAGLRAALRRWAVFAAACPERIITAYEEDALKRALAVAFLRECAGTRGDRVRGTLRRAADGLEAARYAEDIADALDYVRAAVCLEFRLTSSEMEALISPPAYALSEMERRELIYLARAGVRDLKVLAARRLASEIEYDDARRTLEELRYDEDAWVRAVGLCPANP
jgi:hypothetical protein